MKAKYIDNLYKEKVVSTEGELKKAIRENYGKIVVQGNLIKKTQSIYKMRNIDRIAPVMMLPSEWNIFAKDRLMPSDLACYEIFSCNSKELILYRT